MSRIGNVCAAGTLAAMVIGGGYLWFNDLSLTVNIGIVPRLEFTPDKIEYYPSQGSGNGDLSVGGTFADNPIAPDDRMERLLSGLGYGACVGLVFFLGAVFGARRASASWRRR